MGDGAFLDAAGRLTLAEALGDTPQTVMSTHRLRRGLARAAVDGPAQRPAAAIVQAHTLPAEPAGFGDDPERIWALLRGVDGWACVHVAQGLGEALATVMEAGTGRPFAVEEEIYYQATDEVEAAASGLGGPVTPGGAGLTPPGALAVPGVRRLGAADVPLLEDATGPLGMAGWRFGSAAALLAEGFAAGAVVEGRLVAAAFTAARSARYGEIGIVTEAPHRGRGYAAAAAALVAAEIRAAGLRVVWSTSVENAASRRVAAKLGLREVSRRAYVNPGP